MLYDRRSYGHSKLTAFLWCDYGIGCYCLWRIFQKMPTIQVGQRSTTHHSTIVTVLARLYPFMQGKRFRNIFCEYVHTWIKVDVIPLTVWWPALEKQRERGWGDWRRHSRTCNGPSSSNVNTKHKLEDVNHLYVLYLFIQFCNAKKVHSASNAVFSFSVVMTTAWAMVVDLTLSRNQEITTNQEFCQLYLHATEIHKLAWIAERTGFVGIKLSCNFHFNTCSKISVTCVCPFVVSKNCQ
jgi:hypothetical protein